MKVFFIIINLWVMAAVAYLVWRRQPKSMSFLVVPALLVKLTAGVSLGLIYMYYYDGIGDTMLYFDDSRVISAFARQNFGGYLSYLWSGQAELTLTSDVAAQPRTLFLLKLASVFNLLSHDNYWITSAYFSLISFLAAWYVVRQVHDTLRNAYWPAVVAFFFFPTAVFWSSGLIKESLAMAGLFLLSGFFLRGWSGQSLRYWEWVLLFLALWVVWNLKYYFLGVMMPVAIASMAVHKMYVAGIGVKSAFIKVLLWGVLLLIPLSLVSLLHPNFQPHVLMKVIVDNYELFLAMSAPEDVIHYHDLRPEWSSFAVNAPLALFSGLFRPMIWEASTALQWWVAVENAVLLALSLAALFNVRRFLKSPHRLLISAVLVYCAALAVFLALSAPNFGTLSRYKVGFLSPFVTVVATGNPLFNRLLRFAQRYSGRLAR